MERIEKPDALTEVCRYLAAIVYVLWALAMWRMPMIKGLQGREPVGAVLTIGTKGPSGNPVDTDRFYIKVPDARKDEKGLVRDGHPSFAAFNSADVAHRKSIKGVLVHATEAECFEWYRKAQRSPNRSENHAQLPFCTGNGVSAQRLRLAVLQQQVQSGAPRPNPYKEIPCENDLCKYAEAPNERTPPACKPFARLLFQPVWKDGSPLPTPLMKLTTQSWNTVKNLVGFFEFVRTQAAQMGIAQPLLFGLNFELVLETKSNPDKGSRFPVIRISPTVNLQTFLMSAAQQQLAEARKYIALLDDAERDPATIAADTSLIEPALRQPAEVG